LAISQARCGASASAPAAIVTHGAGEEKYAARRRSMSAAMPRPSSSTIDQYLPYIAAAANSPASAASSTRRVSNERRNHSVVAPHSGSRIVFTLNLSPWKLKKGTSVSSASPITRFSPSRNRAQSRHAIHSARPTLVIASR
jgi:hypothetical protein